MQGVNQMNSKCDSKKSKIHSKKESKFRISVFRVVKLYLKDVFKID
jgi:hypothetical protein